MPHTPTAYTRIQGRIHDPGGREMADRPRTIRLADEEWAQVGALADAMGTSKARAVAAAVSAALEGADVCAPHTGRIQPRIHDVCAPHTAPHTPEGSAAEGADEGKGGACGGEPGTVAALEALAAQLAVKDAQIADLMAQCARKDQAIAQALEHAQQLHAMEKARPSIGQRVRALFSK